MHGERLDGGYSETSAGDQIFSLPFEDSSYEMVFVLPKTGRKINAPIHTERV
jgi:hypothetical protein